MYRLCRLALFALLVLAMPATRAAETDIRVIDMQRTFNEYHRTLAFEESFKAGDDMLYLRKLEQEAMKLKEQRQGLLTRLQAFGLADEAKKEIAMQGQQVERQLVEKQQDIRAIERKIEEKKESQRQAILGEINATIDTYCKEHGVAFLLDSSGATFNRIPTVVWHRDGTEITDAILAILNAGREEMVKKMLDAQRAARGDGAAAPPMPAPAGE